MAYITFDIDKLRYNYNYLDKLFNKGKIEWSVVTKLLCGNKDYLNELYKMGVQQMCDSRISNLKSIKSIHSDITTIYIRPPANYNVSNVVKYADISLNTEEKTIRLLSEEARRQNKIHKIIIMMELGELREGVLGEKLIEMYEKVYSLKNIEIIGLGVNLSCLYGILPSKEKLIQLIHYQKLIKKKFKKKLKYLSGGTSVTIHLIWDKTLPKGINHFRVGETLFFGTDVYESKEADFLQHNLFKLYAQIIEISEKPMQPEGEFGTNLEGKTFQLDETLFGITSKRALVDVGLLDVAAEHIIPIDENISIVGATSDILVLDLGNNSQSYKVGDFIEFKLNYYSTLKLLNSKYIEKRVISNF